MPIRAFFANASFTRNIESKLSEKKNLGLLALDSLHTTKGSSASAFGMVGREQAGQWQ
jgi:hypothetical protein